LRSVWRRVGAIPLTPDKLGWGTSCVKQERQVSGVGFLSHLRTLGATMSQKSSLPQAAKSVSQMLKSDTPA
jgi:hypothetical protein